jgi:hypothetical protein
MFTSEAMGQTKDSRIVYLDMSPGLPGFLEMDFSLTDVDLWQGYVLQVYPNCTWRFRTFEGLRMVSEYTIAPKDIKRVLKF